MFLGGLRRRRRRRRLSRGGVPSCWHPRSSRSPAADLIVMGTHGRGGFQHLVLGSVTERVLRRAVCPVLTVPPRAQSTSRLTFRRLLCAIDFSESSMAALRFALSLAQESEARLTMLHVLEWPWEEPPPPRLEELPVEQAAALGGIPALSGEDGLDAARSARARLGAWIAATGHAIEQREGLCSDSRRRQRRGQRSHRHRRARQKSDRHDVVRVDSDPDRAAGVVSSAYVATLGHRDESRPRQVAMTLTQLVVSETSPSDSPSTSRNLAASACRRGEPARNLSCRTRTFAAREYLSTSRPMRHPVSRWPESEQPTELPNSMAARKWRGGA